MRYLTIVPIAIVLSIIGLEVYRHWDYFQYQWKLMQVRGLMVKDFGQPNLPETGKRLELPPDKFGHTSTQLLAGVWVDSRLYYAAAGIPIGKRPPGDDVEDLRPGIPNSVFGQCERCRRSWKWVHGHTTYYSDGAGLFPLCERCWQELTPTERLPYYRQLWNQWRTNDPNWDKVETAVLEGK